MLNSPANLRNDIEIASLAIQECPRAIEFAGDSAKSNKQIVVDAVRRYPWAVVHVSGVCRGDEDIERAAIYGGCQLRLLTSTGRNNKEFVMIAVQRNPWELEFAGDECKRNKDIVIAAVRQCGDTIIYADESCKYDEDVVQEAIAGGCNMYSVRKHARDIGLM